MKSQNRWNLYYDVASINAKERTLVSPLPSSTGGLQVNAGNITKNIIKAGQGMLLSAGSTTITIDGLSNGGGWF